MIRKVGVVGAGAMGSEITQVMAAAGIPVLMKDVNDEALSRGMARIKKIFASSVEKGRMTTVDAEAKAKWVQPTLEYKDFRDVDLVIEAVPEFIALKTSTFQELDKVCPAHAILATNTSSLSVSQLAGLTSRPGRVIGMHFFNPAHVMKLVEVVPGLTTERTVVEEMVAFSRTIKKLPATVQECPGFLVNRLLLPYLNECAIAWQEGAATMKDIDEQMVQFGWPMGPFTLMDMLGIDVCAEVARILVNAYGPRVRAAEAFDVMVKAGRVGQKKGVGFYEYGGTALRSIESIQKEVYQATGARNTVFDPLRPMMVMVNEAVMCLQEQIATREDIELAMVAGTGFPQPKGGPLHVADQLGIDRIVEMMEKYAETLGGRFCPHFRLKMMAGANMIGVTSKRGFFSYD